jgi:uncharacterized RDD family membrane protein YckC
MITEALPIETPEGITFTHEPASLTVRGMAFFIDLLIRAALVVVVGILFALFLGPAILAGIGLWLILVFVVEWGYYVLFEVMWDGQSPGKRLFELRVVKTAGHPIGFYESALRNLLRAADILPATYAVGALSMLVTRRFQRLGDLAADTIVVHEKKAWFGRQPPKPSAALAQAELRGVALSNRERRLLQEFVLRKDRLHPDRREELAEILADAYRKRFNLPAEASPSTLLAKLHAAQQGEPRAVGGVEEHR